LVVREARGGPAGLDERLEILEDRRIGDSFDELMVDERTAEAYRSILGRDQQTVHIQRCHAGSIESRRSRIFLKEFSDAIRIRQFSRNAIQFIRLAADVERELPQLQCEILALECGGPRLPIELAEKVHEYQ
jgi:hypothetical protein